MVMFFLSLGKDTKGWRFARRCQHFFAVVAAVARGRVTLFGERSEMKTITLAGIGVAALVTFAPLVNADPTAGHDAKVNTQIPGMLCEIGSDDAEPGIGPNVICQGRFAQAPAIDDQAFVTASGRFSYRSANIGVGYEHEPFETLVPGRTYHIQGWTVIASDDGIRFTNDGTAHGMLVRADTTVTPF
jgi:hypothetical protein